jgi:UV DNA damage endonuclease
MEYRFENDQHIVYNDTSIYNHPYVYLGLCCINSQLREKDIFCSRTCTRDRYTKERCLDLSIKNFKDLKPILEWSFHNDINVFRISSDLIPHYTDPEIASSEKISLDDLRDVLREAGSWCRQYRQRITMHPGQYNQIGTKTRSVFEKTVEDLTMHADILDRMGIGADGVLTIHGGGTYGDKEATMRRWVEQFDDLPRNVKNRLVLENCEKGYSVEDCLSISEQVGVPVVMDSHHYVCYDHFHPNETQKSAHELIPLVVDTWKKRDITMLCHISEQKPDAPVGAHSDYIETIPDYFLSVPELYNIPIHIEVEAKAKEKAVMKLKHKYNNWNLM